MLLVWTNRRPGGTPPLSFWREESFLEDFFLQRTERDQTWDKY
jgi:hypothetical protein